MTAKQLYDTLTKMNIVSEYKSLQKEFDEMIAKLNTLPSENELYGVILYLNSYDDQIMSFLKPNENRFELYGHYMLLKHYIFTELQVNAYVSVM